MPLVLVPHLGLAVASYITHGLCWIGFFLLSHDIQRSGLLLAALSSEPSSPVMEPLPPRAARAAVTLQKVPDLPLFFPYLLFFSPPGNSFNQSHIACVLYNNNPLFLSLVGFQVLSQHVFLQQKCQYPPWAGAEAHQS